MQITTESDEMSDEIWATTQVAQERREGSESILKVLLIALFVSIIGFLTFLVFTAEGDQPCIEDTMAFPRQPCEGLK